MCLTFVLFIEYVNFLTTKIHELWYIRFIALSAYKSLSISAQCFFLHVGFSFILEQKQDKKKNNNNMKTQDNIIIVVITYRTPSMEGVITGACMLFNLLLYIREIYP